MDNDKVMLAKAVIGNQLFTSIDCNEDETTYYCSYCDADSITCWNGLDNKDHKKALRKMRHEDDCIVLVAKRVLKEAL